MPSFPRPIASKLPHVGTTIFTVMSRLAQEHNAINLSQGFPDFDCAKELRDLVTKYINAGLNQYPPMAGVMQLRERIAEKAESLYGAKYDPEHEVTVVPGATYGIFTAIAALVRPGDEVIMFEPTYDSYVPSVEVNGGVPVCVQLRYPDYSIDWSEVQRAITPKTRVILINTPNNPTASVFSGEDMRMLENLLRGTGIVVVSDEVYEHLVFDGHRHQSVTRFPGLAERSFAVSSFGKTYHVTGWKMGYVAAPAPLTAEFRKAHQFVTFSSFTPVQYALADFLNERRGWPDLSAFYQRKRDLFLTLLDGSRWKPLPSRGTYFQLLDYSAFSDEKDMDLALRLTREIGVASIPTSAFLYKQPPPPVLRFCFAKKDETLERAAERLRRL